MSRRQITNVASLPSGRHTGRDAHQRNVNGGVKVGRVGGGLLSIGDQIVYRPPSFIGLQPTQWMVRWMFKVDVYLRVRRAVMVDGMSMRDTVRKMLAYSVPPAYRRQLRLESPS